MKKTEVLKKLMPVHLASNVFDAENCAEMLSKLGINDNAREFLCEMNKSVRAFHHSNNRVNIEPRAEDKKDLIKGTQEACKNMLEWVGIQLSWRMTELQSVDYMEYRKLADRICIDVPRFMRMNMQMENELNENTPTVIQKRAQALEYHKNNLQKLYEERSQWHIEMENLSGEGGHLKADRVQQKIDICDENIEMLETTINHFEQYEVKPSNRKPNQKMYPIRAYIMMLADIYYSFTGKKPTIITNASHPSGRDHFSSQFFDFVINCEKIIQADSAFKSVHWPRTIYDQLEPNGWKGRLGSMVRVVLREWNKMKQMNDAQLKQDNPLRV